MNPGPLWIVLLLIPSQVSKSFVDSIPAFIHSFIHSNHPLISGVLSTYNLFFFSLTQFPPRIFEMIAFLKIVFSFVKPISFLEALQFHLRLCHFVFCVCFYISSYSQEWETWYPPSLFLLHHNLFKTIPVWNEGLFSFFLLPPPTQANFTCVGPSSPNFILVAFSL